jgi:hypothetical protein
MTAICTNQAATGSTNKLERLRDKGWTAMATEGIETLVICISPGINNRWDVAEKGFEEPLASFYKKEDAYAYAIALTRSSEDAAVLVEDDEGFSSLPIPENLDDTFSNDRRLHHDFRS